MKKNGFTPLDKNKQQEKHRYLTGFTLVELLISATIISLVAITVYSVFASGINVWKKGSENRSYERNIRLIGEKLARELKNTFKFSNIPFEGTEDSIAFAGLVENSSSGEDYRYEVGRISYLLNEKNVFCRRSETYAEFFQEQNLGKYDELTPEVSGLKFSYCYLDNATGDYKWKDKWIKEEQDSIPQALKIELVFKRKSGQESKFTKTIFIPIGTGEQKIELK